MGSSPVRLRPMGIGDLLDETFALYRRNFVLFAGIVALLTVPQTLLNMAIAAASPSVSIQIPSLTNGSANAHLTTSSVDPLASLFTTVVGALFGIMIMAALAQAISARYLGRDMTVWLAYTSLPIGTYATLLGAIVVVAIIAIVGLGILIAADVLGTIGLFAVAPPLGVLFAIVVSIGIVCVGIFAAVRLLFFPQVVVLEQSGAIRSLRRSWHLVGGSWWRVFGIALLLSIMVNIIESVLVVIVLSVIFFGHGTLAFTLFSQAVSGISGIFVQPIQFGAMTLLYYDLRVRKEAFDLELAARSLEHPSPA